VSRNRRSGKGGGKGSGPRLVVGVGPVRELVAAAPTSIRRIWVAATRAEGSGRTGKDDPVQELAEIARDNGIAVSVVPMAELDRMVGEHGRHQGVAAESRPYRYADVDEMLALAKERNEPPLLVAIDGVTDPHNLGAIARSAYLLGAHGLILPRDRSAEVNPTSTKVSAGAVEHLHIAQVTNLARTLTELKEQGLWIHGVAATVDAVEIHEADLGGPICLVLGSEGFGLRTLVAKQCDVGVIIPMHGEGVGSFNVSVAAALALYEVDRQRRTSGSGA